MDSLLPSTQHVLETVDQLSMEPKDVQVRLKKLASSIQSASNALRRNAGYLLRQSTLDRIADTLAFADPNSFEVSSQVVMSLCSHNS